MANPFPFTAGQVLTAAQMNGIGEVLSYTPTMTVWTLGNGTLTGTYARVQKLIAVTIRLTFGTTTAAAASPPVFTLPVNATNAFEMQSGLNGAALDASAGGIYAIGGLTNTVSTVSAATQAVNGTYIGAGQGLTTTVPFIWTTSDTLTLSIVYQAA